MNTSSTNTSDWPKTTSSNFERRGALHAAVVLPTPAAPNVFERIRCRPGAFFLDSADGPTRLTRYSFMGCDPVATLEARGDRILWIDARGRRRARGHPFLALQGLVAGLPDLSNDEGVRSLGMPFVAGAVGLLGYDLRHFVERLPHHALRDVDVPDLRFDVYDASIVFDHATGRSAVAGIDLDERSSERRERLLAALGEASAPRDPAEAESPNTEASAGGAGKISKTSALFQSNFTRPDYLAAVARVKEYIAAGDIFQANISQRFSGPLPCSSAWELYRRLRRANPSPFAAYIAFDDVAVLSSSPERFLKVSPGGLVETRPIKGTRPRSRDPLEDRRLAEELLASAKDNAELAMIVDLLRNDLGRVCSYGTVRVAERRVLETYPTVHHLVSTVVGRLHPRHGRVDLLHACFPGGSITGAPKVRAMEIIDEMEPTARAYYTGAAGYIGVDGSMDFNLLIRTLTIKGDTVRFQVGGGIVADSDPADEWDETIHKGRGLIAALGAALPEGYRSS